MSVSAHSWGTLNPATAFAAIPYRLDGYPFSPAGCPKSPIWGRATLREVVCVLCERRIRGVAEAIPMARQRRW